MKRLILEAPWYTYQKKVKALFERDPAIHVGEIIEPEEGSADYLFDIEVRDHEKFLAMDRVFPKCVQFGNVILAINLYDEENDAGTADVVALYNLKNKYRLSLRTLYGAKNGIFEDEGEANSPEQAENNEPDANEEVDGEEERIRGISGRVF